MSPIRALVAALCAGSVLLSSVAAQSQPIPARALPSMSADALVAALDVGDFTVQTLSVEAASGGETLVRVVLGDTPFTLALLPHSLRAPDFTLLVDDGRGLHAVEAPAPTTVRGTLLEVPGSRVAGSLADGRLDVTVTTPVETWGISPAAPLDPSFADDAYVVYRASDAIDRGLQCGVAAAAAHDAPPSPAGYAGLADAKVCEIALDADFEFYQWNGSSVPNTELDIEDIVNRVDAIYEADVDILYTITTILVRTTSADPYTSTSPGTLLGQFAAEWNANQGGVVRDVAHLFTGRNIDGSVIGIAQLNVICSLGNAYGLSQSNYTTNKSFRAGLTAHELGHNWSAQHCDGQSTCYIMCSGLGGCAGNVTTFGTSAKNAISNKRDSVTCLDDAVPPPPPVISSLTPDSVPALGGGTITVDGPVDYLKVKQVLVDGVELPKGVGGWSATSDTRITFVPPTPSSLGAKSVQLVNAGGVSNTVTLSYTETDPPKFVGPSVVFQFSGDPTIPYQWGAKVGDTSFFVLALDGTTLPFKGQPFLVNNFAIVALPLDAAGLAALTLPIPPEAAGLLLTVFAQVAISSSGSLSLTPVVSTLIL
ncbi:MAG: hypothetical protein H6825_09820 [Planctomycetes bacterium]|nr:hypothetical protein [Planctomycetota bacterium]